MLNNKTAKCSAIKAGHFSRKGQMGVISINNARIDRPDKNRMRGNLEEILLVQKQLEERVDNFLQAETVENYRIFWQELKKQYNQSMQNTYNYMVRKCNR